MENVHTTMRNGRMRRKRDRVVMLPRGCARPHRRMWRRDDDDSTSSEATTGASSAAAPAATTPESEGAAATASSAVSSGSGDTAIAGDAVAAAKAAVVEYETRPTSIDFDVPIDAPIPTGKTLAFINCGSSACNLEGDIIKEAADLLGWTVNVMNTDGTPAQIQNAWEQVIREKPDGVLYTAVPREQIDRYLKEAEANDIGVAACCITDEVGDGIDYIIGTAEQGAQLGPVYASWVVAESNGDADTLFLTLPDFPILTVLEESYQASLAEQCPDCGFDKLDIPLADLGKTAPDLIVSHLRSNPEVKYLVASVDAIVLGLPAALAAAGLDDIKIIGEGPNTTNLQYLESGEQDATIAFPYYEEMYGMVDAMARKFSGVPIEPAFDPPIWLLTKDNVPTTTELFPLVVDVKDQFAALWGVS